MGRRKSRNVGRGASVNAEKEFERELAVFRTEADAAAQFFYAWLAIHAAAADDQEIVRLLNGAALFWNTNLGALQTATFVTLGRIFDNNSTHNLGSFTSARPGQSANILEDGAGYTQARRQPDAANLARQLHADLIPTQSL